MTTTQIKIDALRAEIEKRTADIKDYKSRIERAMQEIVRYQSGTEIRKNEVVQLEKDLETMKESIPDFNQDVCEKYLKYNEMKAYYERLVKDYHEVDRRIERSEKDIDNYKACISEVETRINYLKSELAKSFEKEKMMSEFVFTKEFDNQIDDFKNFVGNPDEVKFVDITCTIGNEVTLAEIANITAKISENVAKDAKVEFKTITDETLNSDEIMVKVKMQED